MLSLTSPTATPRNRETYWFSCTVRPRSLITGERTALNFLQRMSGIATLTSQFVAAVADFGVQVLDTRKIAPGLRALDKYAVWAGGGTNHRMNLAAMVLLKDGTQDRRLRVLPQRQRQVQGKAYRTA